MTVRRYALRRLLILIPQIFGVLTITFVLIRLLPGDPTRLAAGAFATPEQLKRLREKFGTDEAVYVQYGYYLRDLFQADLGVSWYTSTSVLSDLFDRFPATLELITLSLFIALLVGVPAGMLLAIKPGGWPDRLSFGYGLFAGALPEFWWGLMLIFAFFFKLKWFPAPIGRLDVGVDPPTSLTGMYTFDALFTGNWRAFSSAASHLALPVATLAFVTCGPILKMTRQTMDAVLGADYMRFARAAGLSRGIIARRALRNSLPPVVNLTGIIYGFLIGGAVLVETVFSWGGIGQYAVQAVVNSDYSATQGVVLFAAVFSLLAYLAVDLIHIVIDPRVQHQ